MNLETLIQQLSAIERNTLQALANGEWQSLSQLVEKTGLPKDSIRRSMEWLNEKKLVEAQGQTKTNLEFSVSGKKALENGLPEIRFLEWVKKNSPNHIETAKKNSGLSEKEFNIGLGWNKKHNFVSVVKGTLTATGLDEEQEFLEKIEERKNALYSFEQKKELNSGFETEFLQRGLLSKKIAVERKIRLNTQGTQTIPLLSKIKTRSYNIRDPVPELLVGKKQPYIQFLNQIRRRLTELGFVEMDSPLVTQEFYNFDVLFQPQNHPARSWTDTYQLKQPQKGKLPHPKIVKSIKVMHETGGVSASNGWQYAWEEEIAKRLMPAAHGTAHSARQLVKGIQMPGKYFSIARCYRPDVIDATHLSEFTQLDGFIVGKLNFRHLLGMLKQFALEFAGTKEVRFAPAYYPFTEPSCQLIVKHPKLGWMEVAGAGLFRPEMIENLGIKGQALAWGIGIDRLAMIRLGINDVRQLFSDDLAWLRKQPMVVP
ncbi:phenylalanine--tRNA ligase subunit alpha [Candidatus Micrarchaeota archaeon]|nr:phenylalanine--tRNA ligase subunit alpha [Candidatus Micrarchaeota archaeon]MBU1930147.1 phenylalanine--tRNA ligase subunit alpha [Candidatus Micrarchaeota archaeon]